MIFLLIDLKTEIMENIAFILKAKARIQNVLPKQKPFKDSINGVYN